TKIRRKRLPHSRLFARRARQGDPVLREHVLGEPGAIESLARRITAPHVARADVCVSGAEDARRRGRRRWRRRNSGPAGRSTAAAAARWDVNARKRGYDRRENDVGRYAEGRRRTAGERDERKDGDRADPGEGARNHVVRQGTIGATSFPRINRVS